VVVDTDVWADGLCICSMYVYMSLASSGKQCCGVADGRQGRWQMGRWWWHGTCVPDTMGQRRGVKSEERWALVVVESGGCALLW
jgi:hypothetical protein